MCALGKFPGSFWSRDDSVQLLYVRALGTSHLNRSMASLVRYNSSRLEEHHGLMAPLQPKDTVYAHLHDTIYLAPYQHGPPSQTLTWLVIHGHVHVLKSLFAPSVFPDEGP